MSRLLSWFLCGALLAVTGPSSAAAGTLQQVLNRGTLRVGIVLAAPWAMRGREAGSFEGFEIDVAHRLAEDMGVEPELVVYRFEELVPAVESGEVDLVAAGLTITPERALHVNFSRPYAMSGVGIATNLATTAAVERLEDLDDADFAIAAPAGSVAADLAGRILPHASLELFDDDDDASAALVAGDIDVYLDDEPAPTFLALEHPGRIDVPLSRPLLETRSAFAVAKGDPDFVFFLDAWIAAREADTWLPTTHRYWFKSLSWRDRVR